MRYKEIGRIALLLVGVLTLVPGPGASQTDLPELPEEIARLAHELEGVERLPADGGEPPPGSPADRDAPVLALRTTQDDARDLLRTAKRPAARPLRSALHEIEEAWRVFATGSPDLTHLGQTADALRRAEVALKVASKTSGPGTQESIVALQAKLADVAEELAGNLILRANAAGVHVSRLTAAHRLSSSDSWTRPITAAAAGSRARIPASAGTSECITSMAATGTTAPGSYTRARPPFPSSSRLAS